MGMRYKLLGRTGLRVSELCLGAMIFGDRRGGWGASKDEAARIVERFAEAGGNFVDTANHYAAGESERIVGELTAAERQRWVLSTKYTLSMRPDDPNGGGAHRKSLVQSLEASLRRLGTDYLDVYWVHIWDVFTPVEEVVRALDDVVSAGKVLYVGISDTPAWIIAQAVTLADLRGWSRFAGLDPLVQDGRWRDDDIQGVSGADAFKNHRRSGESDLHIAGGRALERVDDFHQPWLNGARAEHTDCRATHGQAQNPKRTRYFLNAMETALRIAGL